MTDTKDRQNGIGDTARRSATASTSSTTSPPGCLDLLPKGKDQGIKTWADLCGKKIVVQRGTVSRGPRQGPGEEVPGRQEARHPGLRQRPAGPDPVTRRRRRRRSVRLPGRRVRSQDLGRRQGLPDRRQQVEAAPYGIAVAKGNGQLTKALQEATDAIIKNGEYGKILARWGAAQGAVTAAELNGGS